MSPMCERGSETEVWEDADRQVGVLPLTEPTGNLCKERGLPASVLHGFPRDGRLLLSLLEFPLTRSHMGLWDLFGSLPPPVGGVSVRGWALSSLTVVQTVNLQLLASSVSPASSLVAVSWSPWGGFPSLLPGGLALTPTSSDQHTIRVWAAGRYHSPGHVA